MLVTSLLRVLGMCICLAAGLYLVMALVERHYWQAAGAGTFAALGLLLAIFSDKDMDRARQARSAAQAAPPAGYAPAELTVGLRWFKWLFALSLVIAAALLFAAGALLAYSSGKWPMAFVLAVMAVLSLLVVGATMSIAVFALRAGYLVQVDFAGLSHCMLPTLPWRHVQGIDLREERMKERGSTTWSLAVALDDAGMALLAQRRWRRNLDWMQPRVDVARRTLKIVLTFATVHPGTLAGATQAIADRAGAPRVKEWRYYESIDFALEMRRSRERMEDANREVDAIMERVKGMDNQTANDPAVVARLDAEMKAAFERMGDVPSSAAHLQPAIRRIEESVRTAQHVMRFAYGLIGLAIAWALFKIVKALA